MSSEILQIWHLVNNFATFLKILGLEVTNKTLNPKLLSEVVVGGGSDQIHFIPLSFYRNAPDGKIGP